MSSNEEHPFETLSRALEEAGLGKGGEKIAIQPQASVPPVSKKREKSKIQLPRILIQEAAKLIFEYWERHAFERGLTERPLNWVDLSPEYQAKWLGIVSVALEMGVTVIMHDAMDFLDRTNGDMGAAFAKAIRRYLRDRLGAAP